MLHAPFMPELSCNEYERTGQIAETANFQHTAASYLVSYEVSTGEDAYFGKGFLSLISNL
jgi:hypothetical protein